VFSALSDSKVIIEKASWRDVNAVRSLEQQCFPKDFWPLLDIIGVLTMPNVIRLKALAGEQMVGFIAGERRAGDHIAWISTVGVLPEFRGQGIGTALMAACEKRLLASAARLSVRRSNEDAIRLYQRLGYQHVEVWPHYYNDGEDALVLEKQLPTYGADRDRL